MRTLISIIFVSAFFFPVTIHAQVSAAANTNLKNTDTSKIFAVVIGISDYKQISALKYADKDAFQLFLHLRTSFPAQADNFFLFLNDNASKLAVEAKLSYIDEKIKQGDKVILYFSGHGDIEEKDSTENFLFLLGNAEKKNYQQKENAVLEKKFFDAYISRWIQRNVKTIFICDACRSGTLIGGTEGLKNNSIGFIQSWQGQSKILACQPNELSYEFKNLGGGSGTFTYYLILGLKGLADVDNDGKISLLELQTWLTSKVPYYVKKEGAGQSQIPEITGDKSYTISKTNAQMLLQAKEQLNKNTATKEYLQLSAAKGKAIKIGDNIYVYKSGYSAANDGFSSFEEKDLAEQVTDNYYKSIYFNFKAKLKAGDILLPEKTSAYYYYMLFNQHGNFKQVKEEMRILLLEALDKSYDDVIAYLYNDDDSSFYRELALYNEDSFKITSVLANENEVLVSKNRQRQLFAEASLKLVYAKNELADTVNHNLSSAIEDFLQLLKKDSLSPYILLQAGTAFFMNKKYTEALHCYNLYRKYLPNDEHIYLRQALVYAAAGQKTEAIEMLEKSLIINTGFRKAAELLKQLKEDN